MNNKYVGFPFLWHILHYLRQWCSDSYFIYFMSFKKAKKKLDCSFCHYLNILRLFQVNDKWSFGTHTQQRSTVFSFHKSVMSVCQSTVWFLACSIPPLGVTGNCVRCSNLLNSQNLNYIVYTETNDLYYTELGVSYDSKMFILIRWVRCLELSTKSKNQ